MSDADDAMAMKQLVYGPPAGAATTAERQTCECTSTMTGSDVGSLHGCSGSYTVMPEKATTEYGRNGLTAGSVKFLSLRSTLVIQWTSRQQSRRTA